LKSDNNQNSIPFQLVSDSIAYAILYSANPR
jgi:hypothetical protein